MSIVLMLVRVQGFFQSSFVTVCFVLRIHQSFHALLHNLVLDVVDVGEGCEPIALAVCFCKLALALIDALEGVDSIGEAKD